MVPTTLRFALSRLWMGIPILAPSQGSLKTPMILFQLCGGTRLVLIFFPWRMVFLDGLGQLSTSNLLDFSGMSKD